MARSRERAGLTSHLGREFARGQPAPVGIEAIVAFPELAGDDAE